MEKQKAVVFLRERKLGAGQQVNGLQVASQVIAVLR
jgi:hypothetical protein